MVPSLTEIILLIVIVICIFGLGKLGDISEALGDMRAKRARGLPGSDAVDITPEHQRRASAQAPEPKPGTRKPPVDEAIVDRGDEENEEDNNSEA